ncbi:hypothetical protein N7337_09575 [Comamonas aquatica]|uniref:hypothetical protein n=1 Tax=Comamonas aquatica TaxID=225991 RepID=UPI00244C9052|nr:hypothetical protein [Comamonas aquatica]MDH0201147.1 hypothetical protein [Comamonas aquatica]
MARGPAKPRRWGTATVVNRHRHCTCRLQSAALRAIAVIFYTKPISSSFFHKKMHKHPGASAMFVGVFENKYTKLQNAAATHTVKKIIFTTNQTHAPQR